jgi:hypothetical protein
MDKIGCPSCSPHKQSEPQPLPRCSSDMLKRLLSFSRQARFEERQGGSLTKRPSAPVASISPCLVCRCVLRGICMQVKLLQHSPSPILPIPQSTSLPFFSSPASCIPVVSFKSGQHTRRLCNNLCRASSGRLPR